MTARQRVAVVGVGAIGGTLGALLHEAGHEVTLCVRTRFPELVAEFADRTIHAKTEIISEPAAAKPVDWVILASKAYDSESAAGWLAHLAGPQTTVVVAQNGVDQVERIGPFAPHARIVPALAYIASERVGPGHVRHRKSLLIVVPDGSDVEALFDGSALRIRVDPDFRTAAWRKLLMNIAANPVTALTGRPMEVLGEPGVPELVEGLLAEALIVANAEGAKVTLDDVRSIQRTYAELAPDVGTSMLWDRLAGRRTEIDLLNGAVVRAADRHSIPVPLNRTMLTLLSAIDRKPA
jgi:2-dehydropantoate 2-reductase